MGRSYDYSPSPPRGYRRRTRSPSPRGRYGGRGRDLPTSLLVRNLRRDCRPDDLRRPFGKFGRVKDIYLPKDYYTREPKGFGFIQYFDPEDASDAKYHMDGQMLLGREITVVFAEENRKKPSDMRARERMSGRSRSYDRRLRSRSPGYSDSPRGRSRSHSPSHSPAPKRKHYSRSPSPRPRERSMSRSPADSRSRSVSPSVSRSPRRQRSQGSV
ncbi:hypothetical protein BDA96_01G382100 [Sorghum bicolor]|uniref:Arginine/serine-rich splicing factor SCL25A transcript I n=2 Tax=Sorghum bicolor TaxID=4558 RepID=C5WYN3_SORBI|nr:serine/arginine-rich SC35-like splicing factor SCL33 [Sorghum bicolor]XP_021309604.1 serine/arginine-rich SC35-like splicing factor SCL33 [Sorghum bicolor]AGE46133.1 arginine/serine-rich splicing factor SCL25A transcript I [Sorghum bicolor]AGE46134.1 arginine/serine-rich splicing factor SCL25A transcript II [Sorghum bicolor]EER92211.1 hypothetical protein SORBI_3001G358000 [Sorghum bicolor]KAG0550953.1 hypothetical protein BDA96_01G382100 [Sorghum bicolor]KXG39285.1 hypothetical protein SO|eukprot:XP_002465213.1 serine/arginine-rich SC35-like splicing factor SCL33 [Sorghum bicolor]